MKTVADMIDALNAKAQDAGCDVRAAAVDSHARVSVGVALVGGDAAQRDRAVRFALAFFARHMARAWTQMSDEGDVTAAVARRERTWILPAGVDAARVIEYHNQNYGEPSYAGLSFAR